VTSQERRWIWGYALLLAGLTSLPYLVAALVPHPGWAFSGFVFGVDDGNSYVAKLRAGAMGAWLFQTPYTLFPQMGAPVFLPYLLLGKLAAVRPTHTVLVLVYHLFRLAVIPLAVYSTYRFATLFVPSDVWRRWVTVMATAGGGLSWLVLAFWPHVLSAGLPLSFISPETFGFLAFYGLPHLVLGRSLLLLGLTAYVEARLGLASIWLVGLWMMGVALVQPIDLIPAGAVMAGLALATLAAGGARMSLGRAVLHEAAVLARAWAVALPVLIVLGTSFVLDPYLTIWREQNLLPSPPAVYYLAAYGLVLVPAASGAWRSMTTRLSGARLLPIIWVVCLPALVYAPVTVQRRLAEGSWVAWLILAATGLSVLPRRWDGRLRLGILVLSLPVTAILLVGGLRTGLSPSQPAYLPSDTAEALTALSEIAPQGSVLLASIPVANAAPAWASVRVPVGHGPESANFDAERAKVEAFYRGDLGMGAQEAYLASEHVRYIFYGPEERAIGSWHPSSLPGLRPVVAVGNVEIFEVGLSLADIGSRP
jgi:hypothetical protein